MMARRWAAVKVRVARPESRISPFGPVMILEIDPSQASILAASPEITVPNPRVAPGAPAAWVRVANGELLCGRHHRHTHHHDRDQTGTDPPDDP
jgi:hypothetical protein